MQEVRNWILSLPIVIIARRIEIIAYRAAAMP